VVPNRGGISWVQGRSSYFIVKLLIHCKCCTFLSCHWQFQLVNANHFVVGVGAGKFLGVQRIFARISQVYPTRKVFVRPLPTDSPTKIMTFFSYDLQKRVFMCFFLQTLAAIFARIFDKSKLLRVRVHPPSSYTTTLYLCKLFSGLSHVFIFIDKL